MEQADQILCLGDFIGYYHQVNEVVDFFRESKKCISIRGNHDNCLFSPLKDKQNDVVKAGIDFAEKELTPQNLEWLKKLPDHKKIVIDNKRILMVHGSPWDYSYEYLYADNPNLQKLFDLDYDYIFFGHTHRPFLEEKNHKIVANPGSVGQSRHLKNKVCALMWNTDSGQINLIEKDL